MELFSIAGVVIVLQCDEQYLDYLLSGLAAISAGAFSMAGGEYVSVSTQKDTEEAAVAMRAITLDKDIESANNPLCCFYLQNGECETSA